MALPTSGCTSNAAEEVRKPPNSRVGIYPPAAGRRQAARVRFQFHFPVLGRHVSGQVLHDLSTLFFRKLPRHVQDSQALQNKALQRLKALEPDDLSAADPEQPGRLSFGEPKLPFIARCRGGLSFLHCLVIVTSPSPYLRGDKLKVTHPSPPCQPPPAQPCTSRHRRWQGIFLLAVAIPHPKLVLALQHEEALILPAMPVQRWPAPG
jgi:hypothetical protein